MFRLPRKTQISQKIQVKFKLFKTKRKNPSGNFSKITKF